MSKKKIQQPAPDTHLNKWDNPFVSLSLERFMETSEIVENLSLKNEKKVLYPFPEKKLQDVEAFFSKLPEKKGRVILERQTAHRGGKIVTIIKDFQEMISNDAIESLARQLRKECGVGGTVRERQIEIQGEKIAQIRKILQDYGFKVAGVI